jgi:hypothetical protein
VSCRSERVLSLVVFLLVAAVGCGGRTDKAFRASVPSVLREAAGLDSAITQTIPEPPPGGWVPDHYAVESEGARALGVAKVYALHARKLPEPQKREWRYLRTKLVDLGSAAGALVEAERRAHMTMTVWGIPSERLMDRFQRIHDFGRWEGEARARFLDALLAAAAAERATLGTAVLPESHPPDFVKGDSVGVSVGWTRDSLAARARVAAREARDMD